MIESNRVVRTIFGLAFAIVFGIFAYISCKVAPHTSECDPSSPNYDAYSYGYDRVKYLQSGRTVLPIRDNVLENNTTTADTGSPSAEEILAAMQEAGTLPEESTGLASDASCIIRHFIMYTIFSTIPLMKPVTMFVAES